MMWYLGVATVGVSLRADGNFVQQFSATRRQFQANTTTRVLAQRSTILANDWNGVWHRAVAINAAASAPALVRAIRLRLQGGKEVKSLVARSRPAGRSTFKVRSVSIVPEEGKASDGKWQPGKSTKKEESAPGGISGLASLLGLPVGMYQKHQLPIGIRKSCNEFSLMNIRFASILRLMDAGYAAFKFKSSIHVWCLAGGMAGLFGSMVGVGGGVIMVPMMTCKPLNLQVVHKLLTARGKPTFVPAAPRTLRSGLGRPPYSAVLANGSFCCMATQACPSGGLIGPHDEESAARRPCSPDAVSFLLLRRTCLVFGEHDALRRGAARQARNASATSLVAVVGTGACFCAWLRASACHARCLP